MKFVTRNLLTLSTLWWIAASSHVLAASPTSGTETDLHEASPPETAESPELVGRLLRGFETEDEEPKRKRAGRKHGGRRLDTKVSKGCKSAKQAKTEGSVSDTLWDLIQDREDEFSVLIDIAEKTGIDSLLMDEGPESPKRTIFVPTDEAFETIMPQILKYFDLSVWPSIFLGAVLGYHIISGEEILSTDLYIGQTLTNRDRLIPDEIEVAVDPVCNLPILDSPTAQNPASFVEVDIVATNGILHVIDQVLTPSFLVVNAAQAAAFDPRFSKWFQLLSAAQLISPTSPLQGEGPITLFGPPNDVFDFIQNGLDAANVGIDFFQTFLNDPDLTTIMNNHVVDGKLVRVCCTPNGATYQSLAGQDLVITNVGSMFKVNGVDIVLSPFVNNASLGFLTGFIFPPGTQTGQLYDQILAQAGGN